MKLRIQLTLGIGLALGCTTTPTRPEFAKARVVETMNDSDEPEWAKADKPIIEERGDVSFINIITMKGNARIEACLASAELTAKTGILKHIKDSISTSGQLNEESAEGDPAYESLTAFLSQGTVQGAKTTGRFWSRVEESDESGERVLRLRCVAKVAVKKSELARQLREATGTKGNAEIREKLVEAQKNFIEGIGSSQPAH
jgi:hypothetical protein